MGIFDKLKNLIKNDNKDNIEKYDKGLSKTREDFVNKLNLLGIKYTKVDVQNKADLEFKDYDLKDVVKLVQCFATTEQRVTNCLCAITSDGVTHILPYPLGE